MIKTFTTDKDGFMQQLYDKEFVQKQYKNTATIEIDPGRRFQDILGFGAAMMDSSCYLLSCLGKDERRTILQELFSPDGLNLSVARISAGASDYSCKEYNYDNTADDTELKNFSIEHDKSYIIPMILEARNINPDLFLFSSPWSPPGWMKTGGSMYGGWMREKYIEVYAKYYLKYLLEYKASGIEIDALTPQNEVETDQQCKAPACYWHPEYEMSFVKDYLAPMIKENNLKTRVWLMDHNYIMWRRAKWMLDDAGVYEASDGVAFHGYEGTADMMSLLHNEFPEKSIHWTEGGPELGLEYAKDWCKWGKDFTDMLKNWSKSITVWNLILDQDGRPHIGVASCAGIVTVDSKTHEITRSGQYKAMYHISHFVQRNAYRINSYCSMNAVHHVAFANPDGSNVVVLTNPGRSADVQLKYRGQYVKVHLSGNSISTIVW